MQFIVDESTGASVIEYLRKAGHDVLAIRETLPQALDSDILTLAETEERILVTNDKDFGDLVFRSGKTHHGILLLRLRDERRQNKIRIIESVIDQYGSRLKGNFVVATERGVRIRTR